MLIKSLKLSNFLSFGEPAQELELRPLNVLIGANGSGKSNVIEAIALLQAAPRDIQTQIREGGGVRDWLWKGGGYFPPKATVEVNLNYPHGSTDLRYTFGFTEQEQRFMIIGETIDDVLCLGEREHPKNYYTYGPDVSIIRFDTGEPIFLTPDDIDHTSSILAQRKDPTMYSELTWIGVMFSQIRLYREWSFGRHTKPRLAQKADLPNNFLEPDGINLGLVLNGLRRDALAKKKLLKALRSLYEGIEDFDVQIEGGTVQVYLQEGRNIIPATRLSDGTLRYLCLLAILCHPKPPPLICIEEPELGLHPDILPTLADLLIDASGRTQLIVTTHSYMLVDALTEQPDTVVVMEKDENGTTLKRLDADHLKPWLEKYRLGELWTSGEIGGTRW